MKFEDLLSFYNYIKSLKGNYEKETAKIILKKEMEQSNYTDEYKEFAKQLIDIAVEQIYGSNLI